MRDPYVKSKLRSRPEEVLGGSQLPAAPQFLTDAGRHLTEAASAALRNCFSAERTCICEESEPERRLQPECARSRSPDRAGES